MVLLTIDEAAVRLGTTPQFIRRLVAERRIGHTEIGKFVRIASADLDDLVASLFRLCLGPKDPAEAAAAVRGPWCRSRQ